MQDRDGAAAVILGMLEKAQAVTKLRADGGCQGPKLVTKPGEVGPGSLLEIVEKPRDIKGFTVLYRRGWTSPRFARLSRCRRLAKDYERSLESSLAWVQLAALPLPEAKGGTGFKRMTTNDRFLPATHVSNSQAPMRVDRSAVSAEVA